MSVSCNTLALALQSAVGLACHTWAVWLCGTCNPATKSDAARTGLVPACNDISFSTHGTHASTLQVNNRAARTCPSHELVSLA